MTDFSNNVCVFNVCLCLCDDNSKTQRATEMEFGIWPSHLNIRSV